MATRIRPAPPQEQPRGDVVRAAAFDPETIPRGHAPAWPHESGVQVGPGPAPGRPGDEPRWATADKQGVGTALSPAGKLASRVWFTIARGILTEVFYPHVDHPCIRELGLVITDGRAFFSAEQTGCEHRVEYPVAGVPLYRVINTCREGRYRVEKTIFAHPTQDAVLQHIRFLPRDKELGRLRVYLVLTPHLDNRGGGNTAWLGEHRGLPMLMARRQASALALAISAPWREGSAGYVGVSDGWHDLSEHKRLTAVYDCAENGNVALTGEVDLGACSGEFIVALGFGLDSGEAGHRALASLLDDHDDLRAEYVRGWQAWQGTLSLPRDRDRPREKAKERDEGDGPAGIDLERISAAVLRAHEAGSIPGAIVASLSTPWGEVRGDEHGTPGTGGYHLVWPRDLVEVAGGLLAAGAHPDALRVLRYLRATQLPDGHWTQNMWTNGDTYWDGIQLGETALPVLLLDLVAREEALRPDDVARFWPMVRRAAGYIVRSGPSTQQDRWENERGYTPFTLATVIASLLVAADLAAAQDEAALAAYLRETADAWNAAIESWLYVVGTDLAHRNGVEGYYARNIPPDLDDPATPRAGHLCLKARPPQKKGIPIDEIVSVDALALVRYGLRAADDPRIINTLKVIDALLKADTPHGPAWRRYNGDGYGENADGSPFDQRTRGVGRAWPLLAGERAHYELDAGRREEAMRLQRAIEAMAGDAGMIPEQVWDSADIPERGLFAGKPTGSARPLAWAHAEYLKLRRSLRDGRTFDRPPQTVRRYLEQRTGSNLTLWRFDHQRAVITAGARLRVEVLAPALVRWTRDGWQTSREVRTRDTGLGLHVADLDTRDMKAGQAIELTFYWSEAGRWEEKNFSIKVVS